MTWSFFLSFDMIKYVQEFGLENKIVSTLNEKQRRLLVGAEAISLGHGGIKYLAEIAIGMYSRQCLGRTRIPDVRTLIRKTQCWKECINKKKVTINWTFTKKIAREKMGYKIE